MKQYLAIQEEVQDAFVSCKPVVALESTLFAHGLPYPENLYLSYELKDLAQEIGVILAVIAIFQGKIKVGLTKEDLKRLSSSPEIEKASLRDLPVLLAKRLNGATTVATTMQIASLVGIKTFVTGGIGGVHQGGEKTFDISADLTALQSFNVLVVSSGAKSILDVPKTRELLETYGITVLGYKTHDFPAFYLQKSGLLVDYRVESVEEVANIIAIHDELNRKGGLLLTNPIPKEEEVDPQIFQKALDFLLLEVQKKGLTGKEVTPFLLHGLKEKTNGATLTANLALIKNNFQLGARVALASKRRRS